MDIEKIESVLRDALELEFIKVSGEGSHYKVIVVSEIFADLSRVKQQQTVYEPLSEWIASGELHALTIKAFTPEQWKREKMFQL